MLWHIVKCNGNNAAVLHLAEHTGTCRATVVATAEIQLVASSLLGEWALCDVFMLCRSNEACKDCCYQPFPEDCQQLRWRNEPDPAELHVASREVR